MTNQRTIWTVQWTRAYKPVGFATFEAMAAAINTTPNPSDAIIREVQQAEVPQDRWTVTYDRFGRECVRRFKAHGEALKFAMRHGGELEYAPLLVWCDISVKNIPVPSITQPGKRGRGRMVR